MMAFIVDGSVGASVCIVSVSVSIVVSIIVVNISDVSAVMS